tara:strand:- start:2069 stop:2839 length:771 start_codon:yes stop_codon:yes gene_type:complete
MWYADKQVACLYRAALNSVQDDSEVFRKMYTAEETVSISQSDAKNSFDSGIVLGSGSYGTVKYSSLNGNPIIIKKFETEDMALIEYHAHQAFYKNISDDCKQYFSKPLQMDLDHNIVYTAQVPLHHDNEIIGTFSSITNMLNNFESCKYVIISVQNIIKCLNSLSISHGDIKSDNVLVISRDYPVIRVIDFGCAHEKGSCEENMLSRQFVEMFDYILTPDNIYFMKQALSSIEQNDAFTTDLMKIVDERITYEESN